MTAADRARLSTAAGRRRRGSPGARRWGRRTAAAVTALVAGCLVAGMPATQASADTGCAVTYATTDWSGGFTASVTIQNLGDTVNGWTLGFAFPPSTQKIGDGWSATWSQNGQNVTATN